MPQESHSDTNGGKISPNVFLPVSLWLWLKCHCDSALADDVENNSTEEKKKGNLRAFFQFCLPELKASVHVSKLVDWDSDEVGPKLFHNHKDSVRYSDQFARIQVPAFD